MQNVFFITGHFTYYELICDASAYRYRYATFLFSFLLTFFNHGIIIKYYRQ